MIQSITIKNNENLPGGSYMSGLEAFKNGKHYDFKPGINIIVGNNGCGKSTLLNIMASYTFCHKTVCSEIPDNVLDYPNLFNMISFEDDSMRDGADVKCDYVGVVYRYMPTTEMADDDILRNKMAFETFLDNTESSTGEKMLRSLDAMFQASFENEDVNFPIKKLAHQVNNSNNIWRDRINKLLGYYKSNRIPTNKQDFQFTFLIDEPDRNLDIDNIDTIYNILSYQKECTQIIAVIHNPILIYKLSKLGYINFVEMTEGYLNKIQKVFQRI